ncbi:MAG: hypothetical protein JWR80_1417 [Bradyrhizobium sp.]|nr:hypothetical protein [Bradyrhizobium sp.]
MRFATIAAAAMLAAGAATLAGTTPAAAYDYPYCAQGRSCRHPRRLFLQDLRTMPSQRVRA